jgi:hypothetical protein
LLYSSSRSATGWTFSSLINCVSGWFYRAVLFTLTKTLVAKEGRRVAQGLGTPESPYHSNLDVFSERENRLYSISSFSQWGAQCSIEYGLQKVHDSQQPPMPEPEPDPTPVAATTGSGVQTKPSKPAKFKRVKMFKPEKRVTQD